MACRALVFALLGSVSARTPVARDHAVREEGTPAPSVLEHEDAPEEALLEADDSQNSTGSYLVYNHCKTCFGTVEALPQSEQKVAGRTAVRFHKDESKNDNIFCYAKYGTQFFDYDCLPEGSKCRKSVFHKAFVGKLTGKVAFDNCIFLA